MGVEIKPPNRLFPAHTRLPLILALMISGLLVAAGVFRGGKSPLAIAAEPVLTPPATEQRFTPVFQLSDVQPTDWAFQALQSLIERYGAIAGYPDGTFQGDRPLTRYEFAAGLNAALHRVNDLIATGSADVVQPQDLETVQRLQEEFAAELASLRGRVEALENRTATLQQRFSPTTKLRAFSAFVVADTLGHRANTDSREPTRNETEPFMSQYTRLSVVSSFTGRDLLTTSFTATNIPLLSLSTGTPMANFVTDPALNFPANALFLDRMNYQFPIGDRTTLWLGIRTLQPFEFFPTVNPVLASLEGPISRFSWFNPAVYRPGFDGVGPGLAYKISKRLQVHLAYLTAGAFASNPAIGFFNSNNTVVSQLTFTPTAQITAALTYAHKYFRAGTANLFGLTGSPFALQPFGLSPTTSDNFGLQFNWRITRRLGFGGWFGYTLANQVNDDSIRATILNGSINLTFQDLLQKGDRGGLIAGVPPKVTSSNFRVGGVLREDPDTSLHLEAFYTYRLNDYVSVTPNVYLITNPNHDAENPPIWVGVIRTTFSF